MRRLHSKYDATFDSLLAWISIEKLKETASLAASTVTEELIFIISTYRKEKRRSVWRGVSYDKICAESWVQSEAEH